MLLLLAVMASSDSNEQTINQPENTEKVQMQDAQKSLQSVKVITEKDIGQETQKSLKDNKINNFPSSISVTTTSESSTYGISTVSKVSTSITAMFPNFTPIYTVYPITSESVLYPINYPTSQEKFAIQTTPSSSGNLIRNPKPIVLKPIPIKPLLAPKPIKEPSNYPKNGSDTINANCFSKKVENNKTKTRNQNFVERNLTPSSITISTGVFKSIKPKLKQSSETSGTSQNGNTKITKKKKSILRSSRPLRSIKRSKTFPTLPPTNLSNISDIFASPSAPTPVVSVEIPSTSSHFSKTFILPYVPSTPVVPQEKSSSDVVTARSSQSNLGNEMTLNKEICASEHIINSGSTCSIKSDSSEFSTNNLRSSKLVESLDTCEDFAIGEKEINSKISDSLVRTMEVELPEERFKPIVKSSKLKLSVEKETSVKKFPTLVKDFNHSQSSSSSNSLSFHEVTSSPSCTNHQDPHVSSKDCEPVCNSIPLKINNNSITNINCFAREMTNTPITSTSTLKSDKKLSDNKNSNNLVSKISEGPYKGFADLVDEIERQELISAPKTFDSNSLPKNKISDSRTSPILDHKNSETVTLDELYELLLVTCQEMVNLRKVQEQILNSEYTAKCLNSSENELEHVDDRSSPDLKPLVIDLTGYDCSDDNDKVSTDVSQHIDDKSKEKSVEPLQEHTEGKHSFDLLTSEIKMASPESCYSYNLEEFNRFAKKLKLNPIEKEWLKLYTSESNMKNNKCRRTDYRARIAQLIKGTGVSNSEVDNEVKENSKSVLNNKNKKSVLNNKNTSTIKSFSQEKYVDTSTKNSNNTDCQTEVNVNENYENQKLSSDTKVNNNSKRLNEENSSLTPPSKFARTKSNKDKRNQKMLMEMAQLLPYNVLQRIVSGNLSLSMDTTKPKFQKSSTKHQIPNATTESEPQSLTSHHEATILPKSGAKYKDERRDLLQEAIEKEIIQYFLENERKEFLKKNINSLKDKDDSSLSNLEKRRTMKTFQPKIKTPLIEKESHSKTGFQKQSDTLKELGLHSPSSFQSSVPFLQSVSHTLPETVKRPDTFSDNQYYSYCQSENKVSTAEMTLPPSKMSFPRGLHQHVYYQTTLNQEKNVQPNAMRVHSYSEVPVSVKVNHEQFCVPLSYMYQNQMNQCPLACCVPPQSYFPSSCQITPFIHQQ